MGSKVQVFDHTSYCPNFEHALSRYPIPWKNSDDVKMYRCTLKAGCIWEPPLYSIQEYFQFFFFLNKTGYVTTTFRAYNVDDYAMFIPNFDHGRFVLHAGAQDMEFIHILGEINHIDRRKMRASRFVLPRFVRMCDAWNYTEDFNEQAGSSNVSYSLNNGRRLGRYTVGGNRAFGPDFVGTHAHPTLTQWYLMLDGSDFIYMAGDEKIPVKAGDVTFTPMGTAHGSLCGAGQQIYYFWFEVNHAWDDDPIEE